MQKTTPFVAVVLPARSALHVGWGAGELVLVDVTDAVTDVVLIAPVKTVVEAVTVLEFVN